MRPSAFTDGNRMDLALPVLRFRQASMRPSAFTDGNLADVPGCPVSGRSASMRPSAFTDGNATKRCRWLGLRETELQ